VKWEAVIYTGDGNKSTPEVRIGTHTCQEEDWAKFKTPSSKDKKRYEDIKKKNGMQCLD